jgi:hypothetical protein
MLIKKPIIKLLLYGGDDVYISFSIANMAK